MIDLDWRACFGTVVGLEMKEHVLTGKIALVFDWMVIHACNLFLVCSKENVKRPIYSFPGVKYDSSLDLVTKQRDWNIETVIA